jgi:hypothetical protein
MTTQELITQLKLHPSPAELLCDVVIGRGVNLMRASYYQHLAMEIPILKVRINYHSVIRGIVKSRLTASSHISQTDISFILEVIFYICCCLESHDDLLECWINILIGCLDERNEN